MNDNRETSNTAKTRKFSSRTLKSPEQGAIVADPIEVLTREHRVIERVLGSLETFADRLGSGDFDERAAVRDFAFFFRDYVDTCHHGKEEDFLFARMVQHGYSKHEGPLAAMLSEQGEGREHVNAFHIVGEASGPLDASERELIRGHALAYVMRIGPHIRREDTILFPMISRILPREILDELAAEFERFDRRLADAGLQQRLLQTAEHLQADFPPDLSRLPSSYLA
jgi:hemerythrin-like domain-containing protein